MTARIIAILLIFCALSLFGANQTRAGFALVGIAVMTILLTYLVESRR